MLDALAMSEITGPNELAAKWQRCMLGIFEWGLLTPEHQAHTADDLSAMIRDSVIGGSGVLALRDVFGLVPNGTKSAITRLLSDQGVSRKDLIHIGL